MAQTSSAGAKVCVLGAGGGTGLQCVLRLVELNLGVRAVVRDPSSYQGVFASGVEVVKGDVTDPESVKQAMEGCSSAIYAASGKGDYWRSAHQVDAQGVATVADAANALGLQRVVLVSSMLVTRANAWNPMRILLNNMRYRLMDNKLLGEEHLRKSGIEYTIIRPGGLKNTVGGQAVLLTGQGDKPIAGASSISRADVAAVCVAAITNPAAANVTLELVSKPCPSSLDKATEAEAAMKPLNEQLSTLFDGLKKN